MLHTVGGSKNLRTALYFSQLEHSAVLKPAEESEEEGMLWVGGEKASKCSLLLSLLLSHSSLICMTLICYFPTFAWHQMH